MAVRAARRGRKTDCPAVRDTTAAILAALDAGATSGAELAAAVTREPSIAGLVGYLQSIDKGRQARLVNLLGRR